MATRQGTAYGPHTTDSAPSPTSSSPRNVETDNRPRLSENLIDDDGNSSVSRSSRQSSISSVRARARVEAARAKLQFATKQADLSKQNAENEAQLQAQKSQLTIQENTRKVHFEADMAVLQAEKEAAIATAEEMVYEAAELNGEILLDPTSSVRQRTEEYVASCTVPEPSEKMADPFFTREDPPLLYTRPAKVEEQLASLSTSQFPALRSEPLSSQPQVTQVQQFSLPSLQSVPNSRFSQQPYPPKSSMPLLIDGQGFPVTSNAYIPKQQQSEPFSAFTKHLMKKELISTGLLKFDDNPANFRAWKAAFKSATEDLELTAAQELNLVMKWLGENSSKIAAPLRAIHIDTPHIGLRVVWEALEKKYGTAEVIEDNLMAKLDRFPRFNSKDRDKLQQLSYLLLEVMAAKDTGRYKGLVSFDSAKGLRPIVEKLPYPLQERWMRVGTAYKRDNNTVFPPFQVFVDFINTEADMRNDVSFMISTQNVEKPTSARTYHNNVASVNKVETSGHSMPQAEIDVSRICAIHNSNHTLRDCKAFQKKPMSERKRILLKNKICFKCCRSNSHQAKDCPESVKCAICKSEWHITAMHIGQGTRPIEQRDDGGERARRVEDVSTKLVTNACTSVCQNIPGGRSCSKICKVKVQNHENLESAIVYAVIDDQSNATLAKPELLDALGIFGKTITYKMQSCAGERYITGRSTSLLSVNSCDAKVSIKLPLVRECEHIPDNYSEIPVPEIAQAYAHLTPIINQIDPVEPSVPIALLIGRDVLQVHKVREQIEGPANTPFAQRLDLGWVIIGESCLETTTDRESDRCQSYVAVLNDVFKTTEADNTPADSIEDSQFMDILETEAKKNPNGYWEMPLPFKPDRQRLPNNRPMALNRVNKIVQRIKVNPKLAHQYQAFMQNLLDNGHAEPAQPLRRGQEVSYLPFFEVFHPMKPDKIRIVYDSSAKYQGVSLNDVLLGGPDLNNSLIGVLMRFRKEPIAVMADIEQMFYNFYVREDHRDYLRFIWFKENDLAKELVDFRMNVHVFGNKPSPSVAIGLLSKAADEGMQHYGKDVANFVKRNFYVDDGLVSTTSPEEAIKLLKATKLMLSDSHINLHKVSSNSQAVMDAFNPEDKAKGLCDIDLAKDEPPFQRSLGICWNLKDDTFQVKVPSRKKECTRRGLLSIVNSIYDPLGFVAPVTLQGRLLIRELTAGTTSWDDPIEKEKEVKWVNWLSSLEALNNLAHQRCYTGESLKSASKIELVVFCDASTVAIGAVGYLKVHYKDECRSGFVMAKSKLAPKPAHTIPRLELCAAVLAVEMAESISKEIDLPLDRTAFYSDSKVVLGYLNNTSRRFYTYVANRVNRIRQSTNPGQWHFVNSVDNPADLASRPSTAAELSTSRWFEGPKFLQRMHDDSNEITFNLVDPESDVEVRSEPLVCKTNLQTPGLGSSRFSRFSNWKKLCRVIARLINVARGFQHGGKEGWKNFSVEPDPDAIRAASHVIITIVQQEHYVQEVKCLQNNLHVRKESEIHSLSPFIGKHGLLRVGGRCERQEVPYDQRHPLILPQKSHITGIISLYHHEETRHQGRKLTEGAIRSAGFWIPGSKRLVSTLIKKCTTCRKLRGTTTTQLMSDLPADRVTPCPPFTSVGLDVFGPWEISIRKTRGGSVNSKRWAVMFTCLYTRAVHIDILESMSTSSMINAFRRFFAFRGPAKIIRSDQGTNFVGAAAELKLVSEKESVKQMLQKRSCTWIFNPPKAPHMGGIWERMIGVTKKILNSILQSQKNLTHEILSTVLCEAMEIINSRPLVEVATDADSPAVLTPAVLLTQKFDRVSAPEDTLQLKRYNAKEHWKLVQSLADMFADQWKNEYLKSQMLRRKWRQEKPNICVGDIVLLKEEEQKRRDWPLAKVEETFNSEDGKVRRVKVRVAKEGDQKMYIRPITKVIPIIVQEE